MSFCFEFVVCIDSSSFRSNIPDAALRALEKDATVVLVFDDENTRDDVFFLSLLVLSTAASTTTVFFCSFFASRSDCKRAKSDRGKTTSPRTSTTSVVVSCDNDERADDDNNAEDEDDTLAGRYISCGIPGICFAAHVTSCPIVPSPRVEAHFNFKTLLFLLFSSSATVFLLLGKFVVVILSVIAVVVTVVSYRNDKLTPSNFGSVMIEIVLQQFECEFEAVFFFFFLGLLSSFSLSVFIPTDLFVAFTTLPNQL